MPRLKLLLAYEGTNYLGWQVQAHGPTIQGTLEQALARITGETIRVAASGRTDAGVHAEGQVVSCSTDSRLGAEQLRRALNAVLPEDIAVLGVGEVADHFHARRDAVSKHYRYRILTGHVPDIFQRRYVWHIPSRLDVPAMARAATPLVGTHDFRSFQASGAPRATTVRTIDRLDVCQGRGEADAEVTVDVVADGFLYNMVRNIVGTLVEVGRGARDDTWPAEVLAAQDRRCAGPTAPPHGLCLVGVSYLNDHRHPRDA